MFRGFARFQVPTVLVLSSASSPAREVEMISLIANLGDVRTLIAHPASMMHSQLTEPEQRKAGAGPEVRRLRIQHRQLYRYSQIYVDL